MNSVLLMSLMMSCKDDAKLGRIVRAVGGQKGINLSIDEIITVYSIKQELLRAILQREQLNANPSHPNGSAV